MRALLRQKRFAEALAASEALLRQAAEDRDLLLCAAIAYRCVGQIFEALGALKILERHHPVFSRLHEERGRCFVDLKQAPAAIESFERAVSLNHYLPASWNMLVGLYRMAGHPDLAATAAGHATALRKLPLKVVTAAGLFADGDLTAAETLIREYLLEHGNHVEAMLLLARLGIARKVYDDSEVLLTAVLELAPAYRAARRDYARVLIEQHRYPTAREQLERLLKEEPEDQELRALYATSLVGMGQHEQAIARYRALLRGTANDADVHLSIGHAQKTLGQREAAIDSYKRAATLRRSFGDAYWSLANLKIYRFTDEEVVQMRADEGSPSTGIPDRYHLCFALGKALEDRGEYAESLFYYQRGNQLKRVECNYRPEIIESNTRQQIEVCNAEFFVARKGFGAPDVGPIFIVGLPRSGSTLLEQILASHSQVEGTQELPNVQQLVTQLRGRGPDLRESRYPRILRELPELECARLGERYLADARCFRTGKPFFIDKMPNNFRHLALIHLILPNARIIDARREPMACCFSNLKQLFAQGQEFTYSIEDIARYYRTYLELMRHWDSVLPGRVLRVHYEDVIDNFDGSVRRILEFCGLKFEPGCLEFYKNERSVRTASSEQVRQPLFREGLKHWRRFESDLQPLKEALGDALSRYRDE